MSAVAERSGQLWGTDGFLVESPEGEIGRVEEVWLDQADAPCAVAVRTSDGRRALLLAAEVAAVHPEERWVVVPSRPALLELEPPRLSATADQARSGRRLEASWQTTGAILAPAPHTTHGRLGLSIASRRTGRPAGVERPLWQSIAVLYACLALVVALVITLAFGIARLVGGAAY